MDKHLEEQLERMRQLTARVAEIQEQLAHNSELIARDRESLVGNPLNRVRDFRPWSDPESEDRSGPLATRDEPSQVRHRRGAKPGRRRRC